MVGIAGFLHSGDRRTARGYIERMAELLAEETSSNAVFSDDRLCGVSRSLKFKGLQPYVAPDLAVWLDGEIYDYGEFAGDINAAESVTAIVAALYRRHGMAFLKTIDGIFAAALYDRSRREIHLFNDRYGLRRLYIWEGPNLVWASGLRCFLHAPGFAPRIDPAAIGDFFDLGYITEDRTWFEDVTLLPSGTVLTWDIRADCGKQTRYWWWDQIKLLGGRLNEDEIADELGSLFAQAVERRVRPGERVGSELSGGLDSRAVVAAMPNRGQPLNTLTVGSDGCADRVIAARVAAVRRAANHQFSLNAGNWLLPRFRGVWLTDGQSDLMHMHCIEAAALYRRLFDVGLCGFAGDLVLGGSYLFEDALDCPITPELVTRYRGQDSRKINISEKYLSLSKTDFFFLQNHVRRSTYNGVLMFFEDVEMRMPFYDNKLLEFSYSLPDSLRLNSSIYKKMLLRKFPEFYRHIPWQKTGNPIGMSERVANIVHLTRRVRHKLSRVSEIFHDPFQRDYYDYANWLRREPAQTIFTALFNNPKAIYPNYLHRSSVQTAWEGHLKGANHTDEICKYGTFEIWLQQAFEKRVRTGEDVREFCNVRLG